MSKYDSLKKRVYQFVGPHHKNDIPSMVVDFFVCELVLISSIATVIDLFDTNNSAEFFLNIIEYITLSFFIIDYLVRLWVCDLKYTEAKNKWEAIKIYITSFESFVDVISIVAVVSVHLPKELSFLRLIKLFRLIKISDYITLRESCEIKKEKTKNRIRQIIDKSDKNDRFSHFYDIFSVVLICLSISFLFFETFPLPHIIHDIFSVTEIIIAVIFLIEYILRIWIAPLEFPQMTKDKARMHYVFSFMSLVDILAIFPVFITALPNASGVLKLFKLCKILRLIKVTRYVDGSIYFGKALKSKKKELSISLVLITALTLFCSIVVSYYESQNADTVFTNGFSAIIKGISFILGFESAVFPITATGKFFFSLMLILFGCFVGVPLAIFYTSYEDLMQKQKDDHNVNELLIHFRELDEQNQKELLDKIKTAKK